MSKFELVKMTNDQAMNSKSESVYEDKDFKISATITKDKRITIRLSNEDLKLIKRLAREHTRGKKKPSISKYIIYCALNFPWINDDK